MPRAYLYIEREKPAIPHQFIGFFNPKTGLIESTTHESIGMFLDGKRAAEYCKPKTMYRADLVYRDTHNDHPAIEDALIATLWEENIAKSFWKRIRGRLDAKIVYQAQTR